MSLESECEILLTKLTDWAKLDRDAASLAVSEELKRYWLGRADGWEEAGQHLRKIVDDNAPMPDVCEHTEGVYHSENGLRAYCAECGAEAPWSGQRYFAEGVSDTGTTHGYRANGAKRQSQPRRPG
jgi:hypothetical protein